MPEGVNELVRTCARVFSLSSQALHTATIVLNVNSLMIVSSDLSSHPRRAFSRRQRSILSRVDFRVFPPMDHFLVIILALAPLCSGRFIKVHKHRGFLLEIDLSLRHNPCSLPLIRPSPQFTSPHDRPLSEQIQCRCLVGIFYSQQLFRPCN